MFAVTFGLSRSDGVAAVVEHDEGPPHESVDASLFYIAGPLMNRHALC